MSPEAKGTKANINKQIEMKLKRFFTIKETISKMKRQTTEWEKICANDITNKGLVSKCVNNSYKLILKNNLKMDTKKNGK